MLFKIGKLRFNLSFTFIAVILFIILNKKFNFLGVSLICSLLHELVHVIFIVAFGCEIEEIALTIFGGNIKRKSNSKTTLLKESVIHLSAPIFNIALGTIILIFNKNNHWGYVNLFIGLFNIAPFLNFDGGVGLCMILSYFLKEATVQKIITVTSFIIVVIFTAFDLWVSMNRGINISFVFINVYFVALFVYRLYKKRADIV